MEQSAKDRKDSQGAVSDRQGPGGRSDARGGLTISGDSPLRDGEKRRLKVFDIARCKVVDVVGGYRAYLLP